MKNSDLFFWFFFALRAWAWSLKKAQSEGRKEENVDIHAVVEAAHGELDK